MTHERSHSDQGILLGLFHLSPSLTCHPFSILLSAQKLTSMCESCSVVSNSLQPRGLYSPWNSPGQNTRVGRHSLLQGIFPTQGSDPGLPHCKWILYQLSHQGSPRILEWVAFPFSRGSSQPRDQTQVSRIAGRVFTSWATWEAQLTCMDFINRLVTLWLLAGFGSSIFLYIEGKQCSWFWIVLAAAAKSPQSCPTRCDPIDGSPAGCPLWASICFFDF